MVNVLVLSIVCGDCTGSKVLRVLESAMELAREFISSISGFLM